MTEQSPPQPTPPNGGPDLARVLRAKARRKLEARRASSGGVWLGLGMMGLIGWSVVVPTLLGAALGHWLDQSAASKGHSWTIALLFAGLTLGCLNAWHWVTKEDKAMHTKTDEEDGDE